MIFICQVDLFQFPSQKAQYEHNVILKKIVLFQSAVWKCDKIWFDNHLESAIA